MKMECENRPQIRILFISLVGIMWCAFIASADQGPYDLDLRELRRPPVHRVKGQQPPHEDESVHVTPDAPGESSYYTVRPGDHLFLILMQRYGLSNNAAERLIPEIMRLNGIRKPKSLSVGQRLTIPLLPVTEASINKLSQTSRKPALPPPPESTAVQPHATNTPHAREIVARSSQPCLLAREVAEQLGASISTLSPFINTESISVSYDVLKMAVVCGLDPAEIYTLERLLTRQGVKLLVFKADEGPRTVIEGVAGSLGISFRLSNTDTATELPLTYLFSAGSAGKDFSLTIRPDVPSSK